MAVDTSRAWDGGFAFRLPATGWRIVMRQLNRVGFKFSFNTIALRIIVLNFVALVILVGGILYLNQFREGLVDAKVNSLLTQGKIIAQAIGQTTDPEGEPSADSVGISAEISGGSFSGQEADLSGMTFNIDPEEIAPLLRSMVEPTGARARVYDREGNLLVDSQGFYARGQIMRFDLPPVEPEQAGLFERAWDWFQAQLRSQQLPLYKDVGAENGKAYDEVKLALNGVSTPIVRVDEHGETVVSVGVAVQRLQRVIGVLMLSTRSGDIDQIIANERATIMWMAAMAIGVTVVFSLILAGTIAGPMHRLAQAAEYVRRDVKTKRKIPDFSHRRDEIGHLSRALNDMTAAIYRRMEAIETFAADVAHELKNPLSSLRSAAELLPKARTEEQRQELVRVIGDDVRRLDRLISEISDASRLDAELARERAKPVNMASLMMTVSNVNNGFHRDDYPPIELNIEGVSSYEAARKSRAFTVNGHDSRLTRVLTNLLDNAASFSPEGGKIRLSMQRLPKTKEIEILVEDEGPGINNQDLEKIFNRFYTDRPEEHGSGQNSGLGLHLARQIVEAHGGRIWAENRSLPRSQVGAARAPEKGARFVIRLPAA
ncbi:MAG: stimulus-sensing domain-containing protein [Dichotomicrobium sp.]